MPRISSLLIAFAVLRALASAALWAQDPPVLPVPVGDSAAAPTLVPVPAAAPTLVPVPAPASTDTVPAPAFADSIAAPAPTDAVAASASADTVAPVAIPAPGTWGPGPVRGLAAPGGVEEERMRLAQLTGVAPAVGFLLRSASTLTPRGTAPWYLAVLAPRAEMVWNSQIPYSVNDGPLWAGKGTSARLMAGLEAAAGPVRLVLAPELVREQNAAFDALLPAEWDTAQRARFTAPWQNGTHAADLPYRFGEGGRTVLYAGESSLTARLGPVEVGAATESQWWGPGVRSALLLSNQAGGFPHALLRTAEPLSTPLGAFEGRWIAGRLSPSAFDTAAGGVRNLSAFALTLTPRAGLSLGVGRVLYQPADGRSGLLDAADVLVRWRGAGDTTAAEPFEQMTTLFARWILPEHGAELYGEWGRRRLAGPRALLEEPEHTQGYTLGLAWARPVRDAQLRLSAEATYLEKSATYRARPAVSWYAGRAVPQGYTHRGQPLGAFMGPGASGQWLGADYVARRARAGVSLTRVRWANDAYYEQLAGRVRWYRAHDVSILGSLHGGAALGPLWVDAEWTAGRRYNFLFQNPSLDFSQRHLSVSPFNHTLRLRVSVVPRLP